MIQGVFTDPHLLKGGGLMGERIRSADWSGHPLGTPDRWPRSLLTALGMMLGSRHSMWLGWGQELYFFYNDAYRPTLGMKDGRALGTPAAELWAEIWSEAGPRMDLVMRSGEATWDESLQLFLERSGFPEETYHTFSYSPIPDDAGGVGGLLCVVTEVTERVVGERRMSLVRDLAPDLSALVTESHVFAALEHRLGSSREDLPFALIYLFDEGGRGARLASAVGVPRGAGIAPEVIRTDRAGGVWPAGAMFTRSEPMVIGDLSLPFAPALPGPPAPVRKAMVLPLSHEGLDRSVGFLVAGVSPYRPLDAGYRGFFGLVARQIGSALAGVRACDQHRQRTEAIAELERTKLAAAHSRSEGLERERALRAEAETLHALARGLSSELELQPLVQKVTDAGTQLTGAKFGAFFYNTLGESGESYLLYTLSGAPREAFEKFGAPRATSLFGPTFRGEGTMRIEDVFKDPRYGKNAPHYGMPKGHLPVRSYLAVPVVARSGEVIGGLFFGHPEPGVFTERAERLAEGLAAQAAVAVDNARLFEKAKREIDDRTRAEAALRESEGRYRHLVRSLPAALYTCDTQGRIGLYNDAAVALWGGEPELGKTLWSGPSRLYRPDGTPLPPADSPMARTLREGRAVRGEEIVIERPDGTRRRVMPYPEPIFDASGALTGAIVMLMDITEVREAERAKHLLAAIVESSDDAIISKTLEGRIVSWNAGATRIFGYTAEEAVGQPITMLIPETRRGEEVTILSRLRNGERVDHYETVRRRKDGRLIDVALTVSPVLDASGAVVGASKIARDITDQKRAAEAQKAALEEAVRVRTEELRDSHRRLRLSERMASLGTLSAGLGHDMGNLLVPVRVCVDTLERAELPEPLRTEVDKIRTAAEYLQQLANGLRLMALDPERAQTKELIDLREWWRDVGRVLKNILPRGINLESAIAEGCRIRMSKPALTQAMFNLIQNAGEALKGRADGLVRVTAGRDEEGVYLAVEDNGPGMSPEVRDRCMEPYFTTKTRAISTGLGLVLVGGFLREAGGSVRIDTEPGRGTTFILRWPEAAPEEEEPAAGRRPRAIVRLANRRIRSVVAAELRSLAMDVEEEGEGADLAVVDAAEAYGRAHGLPRRVIVFGSADGLADAAGVVTLGMQPKLEEIRSVLRAAATELRGELAG